MNMITTNGDIDFQYDHLKLDTLEPLCEVQMPFRHQLTSCFDSIRVRETLPTLFYVTCLGNEKVTWI